jgi:hypothetical protein
VFLEAQNLAHGILLFCSPTRRKKRFRHIRTGEQSVVEHGRAVIFVTTQICPKQPNVPRNKPAKIGFAISPIPFSSLNLKGKDPGLAGLGSYIVNAQVGCNDCHTPPSYAPGLPSHNPFEPPFGALGDGQINSKNYLAGGVPFGPTLKSHNITPDATGKPEGLTLEQFETAMHTGHDPLSGDILNVMPWPYYRFMTGRDLDAIYTYLSALPHAEPGDCTGAGE